MSASGMTTMWFLAPPSACTRLPDAVPRAIDVLGDRRRADEAHRLDVGMVEDRVDRFLVAVHDVEHARPGSRPPGTGPRSASSVEGSRSDGFRMKVLPQAIGDRIHPHRHHGREIERRDAGARRRAAGGRTSCRSPGRHCGVNSPFSRCGMPQANSTTSMPRATSPSASSCVLPCSLEMARAMSVGVLVQQLLEAEHAACALQRRRARPSRRRPRFAAGDGGVRPRPRSRAAARPSARRSPD